MSSPLQALRSTNPVTFVWRVIGFSIVALFVGLAAFPSEAANPGNPDGATDDKPEGSISDDLALSLSEWNEKVEAKEVELEKAQAAMVAAQAESESATAEIAQAQEELAAMEIDITERAINAFREPDAVGLDFLAKPNMNDSVRMRTLVGEFVDQDFEGAAELRNAKEDLAIKVARAEKATEEAKALQEKIQSELVELQAARDKKQALTKQAASSLNVATEDDIVTVLGIQVHRDIAENVRAMLTDAKAAGINLSGGGYRSFQSQIAVRKSNCGTSSYAIWNMPSSRCSPPTARPGSSQHERGAAMDLQCDGSLIRSRQNKCFNWLANNAANYGFYNLPSEPWHWSVNGR